MNQTVKIDFSSVVKTVLFILLLFFLYFIRNLLLILIVSFIVAGVLMPVVDWFEKRRVSRLLATLFVYFFFIFLFIVFLVLVIPHFSEEIKFIGQKTAVYYRSIKTYLLGLEKFLPKDISEIPGLEEGVKKLTQGIFFFISNFFQVIFSLFLIIILSFYITLSKKSLENFLFSFIPKKYHHFISHLLFLIRKDLSNWGWGMLILMALVGCLTYVGLLILNIRFALSLAIFAGLMEIIPQIGPFIGALPAVILALFQSPIKAIMVAILYIFVQQIENNLVVPQVMKKTLGLNPIVVILVLLIGGKIGGILGAIIAVPVTAVIYITFREYMKLKKAELEKIKES
jgi:predicted PurR-regulated permease PerM